MDLSPSQQQSDLFGRGSPGPLVLFHQFSCSGPSQGDACREALAQLALQHGGCLRWAAREEELLCGRVGRFQQAARIHLPSRDAARAFIDDAGHARALERCTALQVAVVSEQPRAVTVMSALLARVLPLWPFDNTIEPGEEPGVGTSTVMPSAQAIAAIRAHPEQHAPVVMINWLKFKPRASYAGDTEGASGRTAYHRYGKVALMTTHSIGAKLLFAARYRQILIGNGGDPGQGLWDEFALMQYPGRATFGVMATLRRYRRALHHREAGLAEHGQGLTVSRPLAEFTWRR
jgi:hypothetical protein